MVIIKRLKNNGAFTLIEILVVMMVIAALAGLAIPKFTGSKDRIIAGQGIQMLTTILGAQKRYFMENGVYASSDDLSSSNNDPNDPNKPYNPLDIIIPTSTSDWAKPASASTPTTFAGFPNSIAQIQHGPILNGVAVGDYVLNIDPNGVINCFSSPDPPRTKCIQIGCGRGGTAYRCN